MERGRGTRAVRPAGPDCGRSSPGTSGTGWPGPSPARHRGLPSSELTFIVTLDDPLAIDAHPDPGQPAGTYDTLLGGLQTAPALVSHQGRWSGVQLGLTPLGARTLLGIPAAELANWDAEAADVVGGFAAQLRELVVRQPTWAERFAVLDELLARRAAQSEGGPLRRGPARGRATPGGGCGRPGAASGWPGWRPRPA